MTKLNNDKAGYIVPKPQKPPSPVPDALFHPVQVLHSRKVNERTLGGQAKILLKDSDRQYQGYLTGKQREQRAACRCCPELSGDWRWFQM